MRRRDFLAAGMALAASPAKAQFMSGAKIVQGWGTPMKLFGVYTQPVDMASAFTSFGTWLGKPIYQAMAFANGTSWSNLLSNVTLYAGLGATFPIHWSLAIPSDGTTTLAQVVAGTWDSNFTSIATTMLGARPNDARIPVRIFWEFQFSVYPWYAVGNEAAFIAAFQRIVKLFLAVSNKFRFEWCPNITTVVNGTAYNPALAWPGASYVDVIGMDFYYNPNFDSPTPATAWNDKLTSTYGLNWLTAYATTNGKAVGVGEWGIGQDNAQAYVDAMYNWVLANNVAYFNYFDINNGSGFQDQLSNNQYPASGAEFIAKFG